MQNGGDKGELVQVLSNMLQRVEGLPSKFRSDGENEGTKSHPLNDCIQLLKNNNS